MIFFFRLMDDKNFDSQSEFSDSEALEYLKGQGMLIMYITILRIKEDTNIIIIMVIFVAIAIVIFFLFLLKFSTCARRQAQLASV